MAVNLACHVLPKRFVDRSLDVIDVTLNAAIKAIDATIKHKKKFDPFFDIGNPNNETTIADLAELVRVIYRQETGAI